jgi:hypothetical protein
MAKISTYPDAIPPELDDYVIGTDVSNSDATKSFVIADVLALGASNAYKVYTCTLNQSGTSAPVASPVFYNNIGTIVWTRLGAGDYIGTLAGPNVFTSGKTLCIPDRRIIRSGPSGEFYLAYLERSSNTQVRLFTTSNNIPTDDLIVDLLVEIRVYN